LPAHFEHPLNYFLHDNIQGSRLSFFAQTLKTAPRFSNLELWGGDLIEWGAILVEVNFYHSLSSQLRVLTILRIVRGSLDKH
jgi:hypothetical protein